MKKNILQDIFIDHYEEIIYTLHPRSAVVENIDKMINCGDPSFGGAMYACLECGTMKYVPFRCHSRFCPSCGSLYSKKRADAMSFKLVRVHHRHCVFTIDENLRSFFLEDRALLNCLFEAVESVVHRLFNKLNKSKNFTPGYILVLHTFGRPLEWNPHIHCLISEGGVSDDGEWRNVTHFNYTFLRKAFQTALLDLMEKAISDPFTKQRFKRAKALSYRSHVHGFYVYAKPTLADTSTISKYIGRYLGRPVIGLSRIDAYDKNADTVTFHYNRHEDDVLVTQTIPSIEFIKLLIQHIPEKSFRMIRYCGIYGRHRTSDQKLHRMISPEKKKVLMKFSEWRGAIASSFGYDPIQCPTCKRLMRVISMYYKHERVNLEELYQRAMDKYRSELLHPA